MRSLLSGRQSGFCVASPAPISAGLGPRRGWQLSWESGGRWQLHLPGCGRRPNSMSSGYCWGLQKQASVWARNAILSPALPDSKGFGPATSKYTVACMALAQEAAMNT